MVLMLLFVCMSNDVMMLMRACRQPCVDEQTTLFVTNLIVAFNIQFQSSFKSNTERHATHTHSYSHSHSKTIPSHIYQGYLIVFENFFGFFGFFFSFFFCFRNLTKDLSFEMPLCRSVSWSMCMSVFCCGQNSYG